MPEPMRKAVVLPLTRTNFTAHGWETKRSTVHEWLWRMGGELIILAPECERVRRRPQNYDEVDPCKYGYHGTEATLAMVQKNERLEGRPGSCGAPDSWLIRRTVPHHLVSRRFDSQRKWKGRASDTENSAT